MSNYLIDVNFHLQKDWKFLIKVQLIQKWRGSGKCPALCLFNRVNPSQKQLSNFLPSSKMRLYLINWHIWAKSKQSYLFKKFLFEVFRSTFCSFKISTYVWIYCFTLYNFGKFFRYVLFSDSLILSFDQTTYLVKDKKKDIIIFPDTFFLIYICLFYLYFFSLVFT